MHSPALCCIIKYSDGIDGDLSQLKVKDFLEEMKKVAAESYRVLKKDKFCAVLMGDTRLSPFWEKEERSGINLTALADNRLFFQCPIQERDDLGTGAGGIGGKAAVACAGGHVVLQRPLDRVYCVDRNAAKVRELPHGHAAFCRRFLAAAQEGHSLGAGAGFVGREGRLRGAGGNALTECPSNGLSVVGIRRNVRHVHGVVYHRRTGGTPQERDDLRTGAGLVGAEMLVVRAGGDAFLRCPKHRIIEVIVRLDIHEVVEHRVVIHKGCFGLDLTCGHGKGVLGVILLGELDFLAILVQHGKCLKSIALVRGDGDCYGRAFLSILRADGDRTVLRLGRCRDGIGRSGRTAGGRTAAALCGHGHSANSRFLAVYRFHSDIRRSCRNSGHLAVFIDRSDRWLIAAPRNIFIFASSGVIVAIKVCVSPTVRASSVLSRETLLTKVV